MDVAYSSSVFICVPRNGRTKLSILVFHNSAPYLGVYIISMLTFYGIYGRVHKSNQPALLTLQKNIAKMIIETRVWPRARI